MGDSVVSTSIWQQFVEDIVNEADAAWGRGTPLLVWSKADGSQVTSLDLRIDTSVRICLSRHIPHARVLSEETGLLSPKDFDDSILAIVDPVDGTESLVAGLESWWLSVGLVVDGRATDGLIYQPSSQRIHDSSRPQKSNLTKLTLGLSPDRLTADETQKIRKRLDEAGVTLISTPHAVEKVAAVLEGRASASAYLPSSKSPRWHSWDVAAIIALAKVNGLVLRTFNGCDLRVDPTRVERTEGWICADSEHTWKIMRSALG